MRARVVAGVMEFHDKNGIDFYSSMDDNERGTEEEE